MINGKIISKLCVFGVCAYLFTNSFAFAAQYNNKDDITTPTKDLMIFEQDDEKDVYDNHGFTRGDMSYLYSGKFDPSQTENYSGEVDQVFRIQYPDQDCYLVAVLSTKTNNGKMAVSLGPVWFLEENGMTVDEGDTIQVTGARMRTNGRFLLIATEVSKNGKSLNIRSKDGETLWGSPKSQKGKADCMTIEKKGRR